MCCKLEFISKSVVSLNVLCISIEAVYTTELVALSHCLRAGEVRRSSCLWLAWLSLFLSLTL